MSLTKVSYSMIAGASANVLDFGAVGDGVTDNSVAFQTAVDSGATTIYVPTPDVAYIVNTPVKVPSGVSIVGANFSTGLIGPYVEVAPAIKKTTNTTAQVETWVGGAPSGVTVARDCVFYCDPSYFAPGSGGSVSGYYPQNFGFIGLSISGPGASGSNAAIFCEFGSGLVIQNVDAVGFTHGFWGREPFSSTISKLRTNGRITISVGGTSMLLNQCAANNGYWLTNLLYSTFNSCTSDGGTESAYNVIGCSGLVFNSCGAEGKTGAGDRGASWNFLGGNFGVVVNGGLTATKAGVNYPTITVKDADNVIFTGWRGDPGSAPGQVDLYVNSTAPSTNIKFVDCYFANFTKSNPLIAWLGDGSQVTIQYQANVKVFRQSYTQIYTLQNGMTAGDSSIINDARYYGKTSTGYTGATFRSDSNTAADISWWHFYGTSSNNTLANIAIYGNGNIENANNSYGAISDIKVKENIVDATPKLNDLLQIRVVNYNLKQAPENKQLGVIAQEVEQIFPGLVEESFDRDKDGNVVGTTTKSVKYSVFVPMLIKALQELKTEFDAYKSLHS